MKIPEVRYDVIHRDTNYQRTMHHTSRLLLSFSVSHLVTSHVTLQHHPRSQLNAPSKSHFTCTVLPFVDFCIVGQEDKVTIETNT